MDVLGSKDVTVKERCKISKHENRFITACIYIKIKREANEQFGR